MTCELETAQETFGRITTNFVLITADSAMLQDKRDHVMRDAPLSRTLIEVFGFDFHVYSFVLKVNLHLAGGALPLFPLAVSGNEHH
jgi:hypothetical protein